MQAHLGFRERLVPGATLLPTLVFALPAAASTLYTLAADVPFDGSSMGVDVQGVIEAIPAQEQAAIATGEAIVVPVGEPVPTDPVGSVACFSPIDFPPCGVPGGDLFVYRVRLDPDSGTLTEVAPNVDPFTSAPPVLGGGFVIDADPASVEPTGEIFVSGGRGVVFQNFSDPNDTSVHLKPGETSAILVTGWQAGTFPLADGETLEIFVGDGSSQRFEFPVAVPEPGAGPGSVLVALLLGASARRRREA